MWKKGWKSVEDLGLEEVNVPIWRSFVTEINRYHIQLSNDKDSMVWVYNEAGEEYSVKLGYMKAFEQGGIKYKWWWRKLWKMKAPTKSKLLMWIALNGRGLT